MRPLRSGAPADGAAPAGQVLQTIAVQAQRQPWWHRNAFDSLFAALVLLAGGLVWWRLHAAMDGYEQALLLAAVPACIALGWFWRPLARLMPVVALGVGAAVALYRGDVQRAGQSFGLKYLLSSQSALLWMGVLVLMATLCHWIGMGARALAVLSRLTNPTMAANANMP